MPTDGIGHEGMGSQTTHRFKVEVKHMAAIGFRMNHEFADGNGCRTALGTKFIETLRARARTAVSGDVCRTHGCREHTITEYHFAQLDRACKMGVLVIIHIDTM